VLSFGFVVIAVLIAALTSHQTSTSSSTSSNAGEVIAGILFVWIIAAIPGAIYYGAMNGSRRGQTLGKMALGIAVRDARTGGQVGFWRAVGRFLITLVFGLFFSIPYIIDSLAPLWDGRRQSWHDKVAHTVVVDLKP
jgi:uncharacterized RDD family membrane protein YckC